MARGRPKSSTAMSGKERMKKLRAKHGTDKGMDAARKRRANACLTEEEKEAKHEQNRLAKQKSRAKQSRQKKAFIKAKDVERKRLQKLKGQEKANSTERVQRLGIRKVVLTQLLLSSVVFRDLTKFARLC